MVANSGMPGGFRDYMRAYVVINKNVYGTIVFRLKHANASHHDLR